MTNFIPIFPLGIVVYPGERVNLHIFEERYKQLIGECGDGQKAFGIPVIVNDRLTEHGTLVKVQEVRQVYEDGKMDITITGLQVFRILEVLEQIPDKLYSGAIVTYPENEPVPRRNAMRDIVQSFYELHRLLRVEKDFGRPEEELKSYDVAHHVGLTLQQELELLQLMREDQRQEYLRRHLSTVLPIITEMENLKEKVKLNGHFRELRSLGFE